MGSGDRRRIVSEGIVHFWDLPTKIHTGLNKNFKANLLKELIALVGSENEAGRLIGTSGTTIRNYLKENSTMRIDFLIKISEVINKLKFSVEEIENYIVWIGDRQSQGIVNPKLPFDFNCRAGARFLAAICNDGWISDGAYYSNSEADLRASVKKDALTVFGGDENTIHDFIKENDRCLAFPSVMRDVLNIMTGFKGVKSENNPSIPQFILHNDDAILGWIEQTIADEGCVKNYPETYRREIVWTRSFRKDLDEYKLHTDELRMLNFLGIKYNIYIFGRYKNAKGIDKIRKGIRVAGRTNLIKLRALIKIPCERKDKTLGEMLRGFVRYKEPLRVRAAITNICKKKGCVTSSSLKRSMNFKQAGNATRWLKRYENERYLKCAVKYQYSGGRGRTPAKYVLNAK